MSTHKEKTEATPKAADKPSVAKHEDAFPSNIPRVEKEESLGGAEPTPAMEDFSEGQFLRKSDGELYALAVVAMNPLNGRTHRAMNTAHYWEGTEDQFAKSFTKEDGKAIAVGDYPPKDSEPETKKKAKG